MPTDHKVSYRSEKTLAIAADKLRRRARRLGKYTIDIVDVIERVLVGGLATTEGLRVELVDGDKHDEPAFVEFREQYPKITLNVRKKVWSDAKQGLAYAYFILAHEIAHILFHDHRAVAFTSDPSLQIQYVVQENSAEWQADTFAKHLTMPDQALRETTNVNLLGILCNIEEPFAADRIRSYSRTGPMIVRSYEGNACVKCSNFTLARDGTSTTCETCGNIVREKEQAFRA